MMGLCYRAPAEREQVALARATAMSGATAEQARRQIMIGSREECMETIDRYVKVGVTHFIFTLPRPFFQDEVQRFAEDVIPAVRASQRAVIKTQSAASAWATSKVAAISSKCARVEVAFQHG